MDCSRWFQPSLYPPPQPCGGWARLGTANAATITSVTAYEAPANLIWAYFVVHISLANGPPHEACYHARTIELCVL